MTAIFRQNNLYQLTYDAGGDLSDHQFRFVKLNAAGKVVKCDTLGERVLGVLQNAPSAEDEPAQVVQDPGGSPVMAGAAVAANSLLVTGADGRAVVKSAADQWLAGVSGKASTAADQQIEVALKFGQASN